MDAVAPDSDCFSRLNLLQHQILEGNFLGVMIERNDVGSIGLHRIVLVGLVHQGRTLPNVTVTVSRGLDKRLVGRQRQLKALLLDLHDATILGGFQPGPRQNCRIATPLLAVGVHANRGLVGNRRHGYLETLGGQPLYIYGASSLLL